MIRIYMSFVVTDDWLKYNTKSNGSNVSAINASQAKILNLEWSDIVTGWKDKVLDITISDARAELFILLKGVKGKKNQQKVISMFKMSQLKAI